MAFAGQSFLPRKVFEPHAARNADAIGDVLERFLPETGNLLEIASGTGQHAVTFGARFPGITWQTSDRWATSRESVNAWLIDAALPNVKAPLDLDVTEEAWWEQVAGPVNAMYASNLLHITAWPVTLGLLAGAGRLLGKGAPLCIYGCFKRGGEHLSEANVIFERNIRSEDPERAVRDVEAVEEAAVEAGLKLSDVVDMPTENLMLILRGVG